MLENIIYGVGGWLGGLLTTLILRWARKDHITEGLAQMDAALSLKKRMRDEGFTEEEIASVMRSATRRSLTLEKVVEQAEEDEFSAEWSRAMTTYDMNMAAGRHYERVDLEMRHAYERVEAKVEGGELERLQKAQEAWVRYRDLIGERYEERDGTMWVSVGLMVRAKITKRRAEDLKDELAEFTVEPGHLGRW